MRQRGFTLVEIVIIAPLFIVTALVILSYLVNHYGDLIQKSARTNLKIEGQSILFVLQDQLTFAGGFDETLSDHVESQLSDDFQPAGGWTFNTDPDTLILKELATTASHRDPDREFVYRNLTGCNDDLSQNPVVLNNIIYFVEGQTLYKRTVTPGDNSTLCNDNYKTQSCPESEVTEDCIADVVMSDKIADFDIVYYAENNVLVNDEAGDTPTAATRADISITLTDTAFGETIEETVIIAIKRLN